MFFGALYYWFPKMFGRMYKKSQAVLGFTVFFIGFNLLYFPLFLAGLAGMPRRYQDYLPEYEVYHKLSTIGSWIMVAGLVILIWNLLRSLRKGEKAPANPWGGASLEWSVSSPPPTHQFEEPPEITHGPYDYAGIEEEAATDERDGGR
jgi:cytochrome c oxidase subunit 1